MKNPSTSSIIAFIAGVGITIGIPVALGAGSGVFRDIASSPFAGAIQQMANLGILNGYSNGNFGPNDTVTRGQVAVMFSRYDRAVIDPLRTQIDELNKKIGVTTCNGHPVGDSYPSTDGCNTCSCTDHGAVCTMRACRVPDSCAPTMCPDGTSVPTCTPDGHVINYFADPCLTHQSQSICGNGVCEKGEATKCQTCPPGLMCPMSCVAGNCPTDCATGSSSAPSAGVCGDGICQANESAVTCEPNNSFDRSCDKAVYCPKDCSTQRTSCDLLKRTFDAIASNNASCNADSDCTVFTQCPLTCGVAVAIGGQAIVQSAANAYVSCVQQNGGGVCNAMCVHRQVSCVDKKCVIR